MFFLQPKICVCYCFQSQPPTYLPLGQAEFVWTLVSLSRVTVATVMEGQVQDNDTQSAVQTVNTDMVQQ